MLYSFLLAFHSFWRWVVLLTLVLSISRAFLGKKGHRSFSKKDQQLSLLTLISAHIQLTVGVVLYAISPIVSYFWNNFGKAVHERQIRFFGMEHITVMISAVVVLTIGFSKVKKQKEDYQKFSAMLFWFGIALLLILSSIPWSFSPLTSRPNFRDFLG
ncbi:hypothetical protein [Flectobacillus sp. BAB-3569]|uniref:hypothetical protein n=1 Tax=Flectobacillus sp. BAB-3569 TaxID=1509483 RepID=UPI000BA38043|nr:hypothetical protein [Flectobacillus sp. BAB-3569]PAC28920.1 hypothetical protein BWI92_18015 [Flectobacillus sp. BAB-3569]